MQAVTVNLADNQFEEVLEACQQVFGEPTTLGINGKELYEWMGLDIRLQLSVSKSDKAPAKCRLSYEWFATDQSYEECIEVLKPK